MASGRTSRTKGSVGERELAAQIRKYGFNCDRMGRNGRTAEDVDHDVPGVWFECKRRETLAIPAWLRQAEADAPAGYVPVVAFRQSRQPWRVVLPLTEFLRLKAVERAGVTPVDKNELTTLKGDSTDYE